MTSSESSPYRIGGINVGLYLTIIHAQIAQERDAIERAYESYPDPALFWCFVDLVDSSNFRLARGAKAGYVRGETFFTLIRSVVSYCPEVTQVKEIGDSVLLYSHDPRYVLEALLLIHQAAVQMSQVAADSQFPFKVRGGISHGPAKRLMRPREDYIGSTIDQLARVMSERHESFDLFVHDNAFPALEQILEDYSSFLTVHPSQMLSAKASKGIQKPVYFRWMSVDRPKMLEYSDHFVPWRDGVRRKQMAAVEGGPQEK